MPGIFGVITKKEPTEAKAAVLKMLETVRHESFYKSGTQFDESLGVYVGWTVLENSFADDMPLRNEQGNIALIFSGEDYVQPDTPRRLKELGHVFPEQGCSYLVHAYEEDSDFLRRLNGRFHGVVLDCAKGVVTLFNDRYGMHRIYYHEAPDAFYFSAEAKAILAVRPELRSPDNQGLGELISFGAVLQDRTLFQGVRLLPAGSAWTFAGDSVRKQTYFQPKEWEDQSPLGSEDYYRNLRGAFSQNLPRYFLSRQRVGVALTGGMDTRVIMAWKKAPPQSLPCYTFGGTYRDCRDVIIARKVASICGQSHQVVPAGKEFLSRFSHYAERSVYLTDGCVDVGRAQDLYLSEKARQIAPVKVVGTYGSEVVRHARMFKPVDPATGLFTNEVLPSVAQARTTYNQIIQEHPATFAAFRQSPWWHHGILALEQTQITVRSPYLDNDFVEAIYRSPKTTVDDMDVRLRLIADGNTELARLPSDRGVGGDLNFIAAKLNRAYLEFTFKAEYAYDYGMPQWVAQVDHLFASFHLERIWLGRHKFAHFRIWYRDSLAGYVRDMLLDSRSLSRPYLQRKAVESIVNGHLKGNRNHTLDLHRLITLELIHRQFFDRQ